MQSQVPQEVIDARDKVYNRGLRYAVFKYEGTSFQVENVGDRSSTWDDFKNHMPKDLPRYAIYDLEVKYKDGRADSKIVVVYYCPDDCSSFKDKIVYSQNKDMFFEKLKPFARELQVNDHNDITEEDWASNFK